MAKQNQQKKKRRYKNMFHTPKTIGERTRLKMTPLLRGLSWGSLALQAGSSIFSIVGYVALTQAGYVDGWILLVLPIVMWVLSIVARLGFRYLPLDMWRMPVDVRKGLVVCQGWYLKLATLLVELECAAAFLYVDITLYLGHTPLDVVMVIWLVALLASVWLPCRRAGKIGRGELAWKGEQPEQNQGQA